MGLRIGSAEPDAIYLGSNPVDKVYLGSTQVWSPAASGYGAEVMADSPLAFWKLDEPGGSTSAVDSSGNGRTASGSPVFGNASTPIPDKTTAGFSNFGLLDAGDVLGQVGASITVECFMRLNTGWPGGGNGQWAPLVTKGGAGGGWGLSRRAATNSLSFNLGFNSGFGSVTASAEYGTGWTGGAWFHAVGTYDGSNLRLYQNGVLVATTAYAGGIASNSAATRIAHWAGATNRNFGTGFLSHVAIFGTALSAGRISAHYAARVAA